MGKEDVIFINQYNSASLEQRTSGTGKVRYVIKTSSEPVAFNLDPKQIGANVTAAIIQHLRNAVKSITAEAAPNTIKARKVEAKAYAAGKPWAVKRYSGGKTGATPP